MTKRNFFLSFIAILSVAALTSCDEESSESDRRTYTYTVNFFDDSDTPVQVGYAYVSEGEKAVFHSLMGKDAYDYKSKATASIPVGKKNVFDSFKGTYDSSKLNKRGEVVEGEVDLTNIKNDCDVYAKFNLEDLTYRVAYRNGLTTLEDHANETFKWGQFASLPNDPEGEKEWGYTNPFVGWNLDNGHFSDRLTRANANKAKFLHGEGNPNEITSLKDESGATSLATQGSFYEDTLTLDFYGYSGTFWYNLGNFDATTSPKVFYIAEFAHEVVQFTVRFYASAARETLLGSLELDYASTVSFDNNTFTISGTSNGEPTSLDVTSLGTKPVYWTGVHSSDSSVPEKYRGQPITNHATSGQKVPVAAPIDFWPVF